MQATSGQSEAQPSPYLGPKVSKLPEYIYQAATLLAVLLLLWTAAA